MYIPSRWNEVETLISQRPIEQLFEHPRVSQQQLETDIQLLKNIFPEPELESTKRIGVVWSGLCELYEFEQFGRPSPNGWRLRLLHLMCEMLRRIEHVDGYRRLLNKFKSHEGMYNQLCVTCYFQSFSNVMEIEANHGGVDTDIVVSLKHQRILVHVKTVHQAEKSNKVDMFSCKLTADIGKRAKSKNGTPLGIVVFDGVVPTDLTDEEATRIISGIPSEPGRYRINFGKGYQAIVELGWTTTGKIRGPDVFRNLNSHLADVEAKIVPSNEYMNVFVGFVGAALLPRDFGKPRPDAFEARRLDAEFFLMKFHDTTSVIFERSPMIYSRRARTEFANLLDTAAPKELRFP